MNISYRIIPLICFFFISSISKGNNFKTIPEELKKGANAIIRYEEKEFVVNSEMNGVYNVRYAITILNQNGDKHANLRVFYDNYKKISSIKGNVYDHAGNLIRKIKPKDIGDQSITYSGSLFDDLRVKFINIYQNRYPYTVEYEYTITYDGFISFPQWNIYPDYNVAVEKSEYIVKTNLDYNFHYKTNNYKDNKVKLFNYDLIEYKWDTINLHAIKKEPYRSHFSEHSPTIYFAPDRFYYDGYSGNQSTWKEYGKWVHKLLEGRDQISNKTRCELFDLVKDVSDSIQITRLVYEYMQSRTRYVSIQLGIGGFQPFSAFEVDELGYGDCKALTNYTKALLKEVGIYSIYSEVYGGSYKRKFNKDFPGTNQGNHIILCVPFEKDTVWLECTDQNQPFGYLGSFTDDRYAILIKETGGELVKTKSYTKGDNLQSRLIKAKVDENGSIECHINTCYKAIQYDNISHQLLYGQEDQKKNILNDLKLNDFEIIDFNYTQQKNIIPAANEKLDLKVRNYGSLSGKRMFLPLNMINKQNYIPKKIKNRNSEVVLNYEYTDIDTIHYTIPENYTFEFVPDSSNISSKFGEYISKVTVNEKELLYIRELKRNKGWFPPEDYDELIKFLKDISKADNKKAILIKNN